MSPERQRVIVAELCGWKHRDCTNENPVIRQGMRLPNTFFDFAHAWWKDDDSENTGVYANPPNYLNDLNAMHEAEMRLKDFQQDDFRVHLMRICGGEAAIHATGGQRAEALIRTLNKWEGA